MIDSVSIRVPNAKPPACLAEVREGIDRRNGLLTTYGTHRNLRVRYNAEGRLSIEGSLPSLLTGSNVRTLTRAEIEEAVRLLASTFGFDPRFARVFTLEISATLSMTHPVAAYLSALGPAPYRKVLMYVGETITYFNTLRSITFYDKGKQAGVEGYLLRYEVKIKGRLKDQIGWPLVLADLYDGARLPLLTGFWVAEYQKIGKCRRGVLSRPTGVRDMMHQLARFGLEAVGGEGYVRAMLGSWDMERHTRSACKRALRTLASGGQLPEDTALVTELDEAVEQAVARALAGS